MGLIGFVLERGASFVYVVFKAWFMINSFSEFFLKHRTLSLLAESYNFCPICQQIFCSKSHIYELYLGMALPVSMSNLLILLFGTNFTVLSWYKRR